MNLRVPAAHRRGWRVLAELALVAVGYLAYSASRLLAADDPVAAAQRARSLLHLEWQWRMGIEAPLNAVFAGYPALGVAGSLWYATGHYVVTAAVLVWLYLRRPAGYRDARNVLMLATAIALVFYLVVPTAPPRLLGGEFHDVLALTADYGWWGADASAPRGLGSLTNEYAALPSMHAGWALWVLFAVRRSSSSRTVTALAAAYALTTAVVVVGTGNHWVLDVVAGWFVVLVADGVVRLLARRGPRPVPALERLPGR